MELRSGAEQPALQPSHVQLLLAELQRHPQLTVLHGDQADAAKYTFSSRKANSDIFHLMQMCLQNHSWQFSPSLSILMVVWLALS